MRLWVCLNVIPLWGGVLFVCGCFAIDGAEGVAGSGSLVGEKVTTGVIRCLHSHSGQREILGAVARNGARAPPCSLPAATQWGAHW